MEVLNSILVLILVEYQLSDIISYHVCTTIISPHQVPSTTTSNGGNNGATPSPTRRNSGGSSSGILSINFDIIYCV